MRPRVIRGLALSVVLLAGFVSPPAAADAGVGLTVERLGGADRFATAALISAAHHEPGPPIAFVTTGLEFADALAAGPVAAALGGPILLVRRDAIPGPTATELARLRPGRIVVLGGPGVVSEVVAAALAAYQTGGGIERWAGPDRFATAAAISAAHFAAGVPVAFVATGLHFPDGLAGGVAAGLSGGPILLTRPAALPDVTAAELRRLQPRRIVILGGTGVVSDAVAAQLAPLAAEGITRLAGPDRYATAIQIAHSLAVPPGGTVLLATGLHFPDALAGVPAAVGARAPLLLVPGDRLPSAVLAELRAIAPTRVVLLGASPTLSERVHLQLRVGLGDLPPLPACQYLDLLTPLHDLSDWPRTLVDTIYRLPAGYHPPDLVDISRAGLNAGYQVRGLVVSDLAALASAARAAGAPIRVVSAYRSYATQQATFDYWVRLHGYERALRVSARPGHSEHQLGTTLDFASLSGGAPWDGDWGATVAGRWMAANGWRYGFVMSYPKNAFGTVCYDSEPWHWRYVGRSTAFAIRQSGLTLREWQWLYGTGDAIGALEAAAATPEPLHATDTPALEPAGEEFVAIPGA